MAKYLVEYRENQTKKPLPELTDFIFIGQYEAETPQEAVLKVEAVTGRENIAFKVTEVLPDGQKAEQVHLIDFI